MVKHLENCEPNSKKLWSTISSIYNPIKKTENQSIKFGKKHYLNPKKIANNLTKQYTLPTETKPTKPFRKLLRKIKKNKNGSIINITTDQVERAIKK